MFTKVTLLLGGNKGDRKALLKRAVDLILQSNPLVIQSSVFETEAWGGVAKGAFLNQAIQIKTDLSEEELLEFIQKIESELGRQRDEPWGDRTMDIDILFFGDQQISSGLLQIPHPFLAQRKFVLVPLVEIMPDYSHPVYKKTMQELLAECRDQSEVWLSEEK